MHQVTAVALHIQLKQAYADYLSFNREESALQEKDWVAQQKDKEPQFCFWYDTLEFILLILEFVKSIRSGDFELYINTLELLMPWVFALDHLNYAKCLPVHLRDMCTLEERHPAVHKAFHEGQFVGQKSLCPFSKLALDQTYEQLIDVLKDDGGIIGLTEDPAALRRYMTAGPELSRLIQEFERPVSNKYTKHHEQYSKFQNTFLIHVTKMNESFSNLGNPFIEDSGQLIDLATSAVMTDDIILCIRQVTKHGCTKYEEFFEDRISTQKKTWTSTLKRMNLSLFSDKSKPKKKKNEVSVVKEERAKVIHMLHASHSGRDVEDVLAHETSDMPPSLTRAGKMHHGNKADILTCLEAVTPELSSNRPNVDVIINDGSVIVHLLRPTYCDTFRDYINNMFLPYITQQLISVYRIDNVWDVYSPDSLKFALREDRGKGVRRKITLSTKIPGNWSGLLRVDQNKTELYALLAESLQSMRVPLGKQVITTSGTNALLNPLHNTERLSPCTHEEADTRMLLHVADAVHCGYRHILIRTNDSDVVVISIHCFPLLNDITELWVAIGTGVNFRYLPIHAIARQLGPDKCMALPIFHAFTGCDVNSSFYGIGKKSAWEGWVAQPELTSAFKSMSRCPSELSDDILAVLERYVVFLYDHDLVASKNVVTVNSARYELFHYSSKDFDHIPPTKDALVQHTLRTIYYGGHVCSQALIRCPELPNRSLWGMIKENDHWMPKWTTTETISNKLKSLNVCKCKVACKPPCKCYLGKNKCTALCYCRGDCFGNPKF